MSAGPVVPTLACAPDSSGLLKARHRTQRPSHPATCVAKISNPPSVHAFQVSPGREIDVVGVTHCVIAGISWPSRVVRSMVWCKNLLSHSSAVLSTHGRGVWDRITASVWGPTADAQQRARIEATPVPDRCRLAVQRRLRGGITRCDITSQVVADSPSLWDVGTKILGTAERRRQGYSDAGRSEKLPPPLQTDGQAPGCRRAWGIPRSRLYRRSVSLCE